MATSQAVVEAICERAGIDTEENDLKIRYGKNGRIVLGEMASGEQRNEVTPERGDLILEAIKEPVTVLALDDYSQRKPQLEILKGSQLLFRQERDGTISNNTLWQAETDINQQGDWGTEIVQPVEIEPTPIALMSSQQEITDRLVSLVNPLQETQYAASAMVGEYSLVVKDTDLLIMHEGTPILDRQEGDVILNILTEDDILELSEWVSQPDVTTSISSPQALISPSAEFKALPPALDVASQQIEQLPQPETKAFFRNIMQDVSVASQQAVQAIKSGLESQEFQKAKQMVVEGAKTTYSAVQEELASERVQTLKQQAKSSLQEAGAKALELTGRGLEKAGQWLASRPEAIRSHQAAQAAHEVFQQGFNRTQEHQYEHHGFRVELEGSNTYRLSNTETGEDLMRFKAEKVWYQPEPKLIVLEQIGITREQSQALFAMRQDAMNVRGSVEAEAVHSENSQEFAAVAKEIAAYNETSNLESDRYTIQIGENGMVVSGKDGRGELYREEEGKVTSNLTTQDFAHAKTAKQNLETALGDQEPETELD